MVAGEVMMSSEIKTELKQNFWLFFMIWIAMVLGVFLYLHVMLLFSADTTQKAHALSRLINEWFQPLTVGLSIGSISFVSLKALMGTKAKRTSIYGLWLLLVTAAFSAFSLDSLAIYSLSKDMGFAFTLGFEGYWAHTDISYAALWLSAWLLIGIGVLAEGRHKPLFGYAFVRQWGKMAIGIIPFSLILPLLFCAKNRLYFVEEAGSAFLLSMHGAWALQSTLYVIVLTMGLKQKELNRGFVSQHLKIILTLSGLLFAAELIVFMKLALAVSHGNTWPYQHLPSWKEQTSQFLSTIWPVMVLAGISYTLWRYHHGKSKLGEDESKVSQEFGSACFASRDDLKKLNFYDENMGPIIGIDEEGHNLYAPLNNKLIISPPGGGKTTASSIPLLLQHDGPILALDVKGELWATTAEYRKKVLRRTIVTIDPFRIVQQASFAADKEASLLKEYHINPFDWLSASPQYLDRLMNAFSSSFLITSDLHTSHFDENAKILIRGYIDYLARSDHKPKNLPELFRLLSVSLEDNKVILQKMIELGGRAEAAAHQIGRVGSNERGSILSTTYRQIDWLGDSNMSRILKNSNFTLKDFLRGDMDIYVIIPEDQIKEHGRLMRMIMALLMGIIIQADPSELPQKKIVFLLEELAQLGNYPDVELCIEVLRARNVVIWTVFQSLKQIELFQKPDLFKSAALKQIFTTDDVDTMEWVQALAGKKTILTKGKSEDKSKSRESSQWFGGSISRSQGESIHETGVDLLPLNEIREMDKDTQLVFYSGAPVIRCKKSRYFESEKLKDIASSNPLA